MERKDYSAHECNRVFTNANLKPSNLMNILIIIMGCAVWEWFQYPENQKTDLIVVAPY